MPQNEWREGLKREKFAAVVLYLLRGCRQTPPGVTALIKLVWYSDYWHYQRHLRSITGGRYVALENGPVLDGYKELFRYLEDRGLIEMKPVPIQGQEFPKKECFPKAAPDDALLTATEIEVMDSVLRKFGGLPGVRLSKLTHLEPPWLFAWDEQEQGRHIPYVLFRWAENLPSETDIEAARTIIASRPKLAAEIRKLNERAADPS